MPSIASRPLAGHPLIARLPGLFTRTRHAIGRIGHRWTWPTSAEPTIFHITHHKAGSQWIHRIFQTLAYDRVVLPEVLNNQFLRQPVKRRAIYPHRHAQAVRGRGPTAPSRHFVVIRDLPTRSCRSTSA